MNWYTVTLEMESKIGLLALPRLVPGDRTDFRQKRYYYSYSGRGVFFSEGILNPPPPSIRGGQRGVFAPARNDPF